MKISSLAFLVFFVLISTCPAAINREPDRKFKDRFITIEDFGLVQREEKDFILINVVNQKEKNFDGVKVIVTWLGKDGSVISKTEHDAFEDESLDGKEKIAVWIPALNGFEDYKMDARVKLRMIGGPRPANYVTDAERKRREKLERDAEAKIRYRKFAETARKIEEFKQNEKQLSRGVAPKPGVEVVNWKWYTEGRWRYAVGEVKNTGNVPINYVKIIVTFLDPKGNVADTDFTYTELDVLRPGQSSAFKLTNSYSGAVDKARIQVDYNEVD